MDLSLQLHRYFFICVSNSILVIIATYRAVLVYTSTTLKVLLLVTRSLEMKKIALKVFGRRIKAATCKPTSVKTKHFKNSKILSTFYGWRFNCHLLVYRCIVYNMKVYRACILKINIYSLTKKLAQNKYSKKMFFSTKIFWLKRIF